jgi:XTP/dITP diphosphohydrolase
VKARLASRNPHKLDELRHALPGWSLELADVTGYPPETGATYVENARAKALHARASAPATAWVIGEDSGVEVLALDGAPGLRSARWATDGVARLLAELDGAADRRARYVCAVVAVSPAGRECVGEGVLDGRIESSPRGEQGFGYDPIFAPRGEVATVAELGDVWKRDHSHRARAAAALLAGMGPESL